MHPRCTATIAEKGVAGKDAALTHWLNAELPRARAGLERVKSGYMGPVSDFEALAPAVVTD